jgi:mycothiol synthase
LKIRAFVQGEDEAIWLTMRNESFTEYDDFRPGTMEDIKIWEKSPEFDPVGLYIAEVEDKPVGCIQAHVDRERKEKKGFVQGLCVIPAYRRRGIGRALLETALSSLRERGMETAQAWSRDDKPAAKHLLESIGFQVVRVFSTMRRDLSPVVDVELNREVTFRSMNETPEDLQLMRELNNEAFKEHFNFRPSTIEEWRHWSQHPDFDREGWFFTYLGTKPVGFVGTWIDRKYVTYRKEKLGWIDSIGVLKPHRNKDIGSSLMLKGMEHLRKRRMTYVELGVDDSNPTSAIKLYEKVGFNTKRKELTYSMPLTP